MRFPFFRNRDSVKNGILISIRRTGDGFHPGLFNYDTDYTIFNVCGSDIRICDDELAEALKHLSERNRENLLMYYFLEMSDTEIAKRQNISRSGVFQNRHNSLELMKKILKEK